MKRTASKRAYTVTLEGPYGEIKRVQVEIPFYFTAARGDAKVSPDVDLHDLDAYIALREAIREDIGDIPASTNDEGRWVEFKMEGHQDLTD